jgi:hypothetical protein
VSTDQSVTFTVDFTACEVTDVSSKNSDTNMVGWLFDKLTGKDPYAVDFGMKTEGNLTITITIGESSFTINGKSDGKALQLQTVISNVDKDTGAVIKYGDPKNGLTPFVAGAKQGGTTEDAERNQNIPLLNGEIKPDTKAREEDQNTPTTTDLN